MSKEITPLEALEEISLLVDVSKKHINKYLNIIEKELKEKTKKEQALEIIITKEINISMLKSYIKCGIGVKDFTFKEYSKYNYKIFGNKKLTQEEFDLLKEVLL